MRRAPEVPGFALLEEEVPGIPDLDQLSDRLAGVERTVTLDHLLETAGHAPPGGAGGRVGRRLDDRTLETPPQQAEGAVAEVGQIVDQLGVDAVSELRDVEIDVVRLWCEVGGVVVAQLLGI